MAFVRLRIFAFMFLVLGACVPENTATSLAFAKTEQDIAPNAMGHYLFYLQSKQDLDYKNAITFLHEAIQADPTNEALNGEMFMLLSAEGQIRQAVPYALKEVNRNPNNLLATLVLVIDDVHNKNPSIALQRLNKIPKTDDGILILPLFEAWIYAGLDDEKKALTALEKVNIEGADALYLFNLALLNDLFNNEDATEKYYERLLQEPGGMSLRVLQTYGNFLLRQKENKKFGSLMRMYRPYALNDLSFFTAGAPPDAKKIPKSIPTAQAGLAEAFFDIAGILAEKNLPESALLFTRFSLYLDPSLSLARVLLNNILTLLGRSDEVIALYEQEKEESEIYLTAQIRLAKILAEKGKASLAEKKLSYLTEKRPDLALPFIEMGDVLVNSKQYLKAVIAYNEAIKRTSKIQPHDWGLFYARGVAYERSGQGELAEKDFIKALELSPNQPVVLNYLGYFWLERGKNIPKAKEMIELAVLKAPRNGFITDSLGWTYYLLKEYETSVLVLEKAVSLDPGSATINDHLGDAYWRTDRQREAKYQWSKALDLNNDLSLEDRKRILEKLAKGLDIVGDKKPVSEKKR